MDNNTDIKKDKKRSFLDLVYDLIINIILIGTVLYAGFLAFQYFDPYDFYYYYNKIVNKIDYNTLTVDKNEYYLDDDYIYVQNSKYIHPSNKEELINAMHTFINSGQDEIMFTCTKEYADCGKDAQDLIYDSEKSIISKIYEFSHPFNDYTSISCGFDERTHIVSFKIKKKYTSDKIDIVNKKVDEIFNQLYNSSKSDVDNIKTIHDYLVNNIDYDKEKSDFIEKITEIDSPYDSTTAYGALVQHKAVCGGYTDAMFLFLQKMNIRSMRITSDNHIWNAVFINNRWLHLDLTWDDGKYTTGRSFLSHKYFLIDLSSVI